MIMEIWVLLVTIIDHIYAIVLIIKLYEWVFLITNMDHTYEIIL
jgi:hypothetical protein